MQNDLEGRTQRVVAPRLEKIAMHRALVDGASGDVELAARRDQESDGIWILNLDELQQIEPVTISFHREIRHDGVERTRLEQPDRFSRRGRLDELVAA